MGRTPTNGIRMAQIFVLAFSVLMQVAAANGLGDDGEPDTSAQASSFFWVYVAETFAFLGMATSRLSVGLFMLRLVTVPWQKISIWLTMVTLSIICVSMSTPPPNPVVSAQQLFTLVPPPVTIIFVWASCTPVAFAWDYSLPNGHCIRVLPVYIVFGGAYHLILAPHLYP